MATKTTTTELNTMTAEDLLREIREQKNTVAKLRMAVQSQKEKDTAKYKREKKQLARMQTALSAKQQSTSTPSATPSAS